VQRLLIRSPVPDPFISLKSEGRASYLFLRCKIAPSSSFISMRLTSAESLESSP
jgi:hypothetical protein